MRGSRRAGLVRRAKRNESMRVGYETFMLCLPTIVVSITRIHLPRREWKRERERNILVIDTVRLQKFPKFSQAARNPLHKLQISQHIVGPARGCIKTFCARLPPF